MALKSYPTLAFLVTERGLRPSDCIRIDNIKCHFGPVKAVDGLSWEMPTGVVFRFLGPNGAAQRQPFACSWACWSRRIGRQVPGYDARLLATQVRSRTSAPLEHSGW